MTAAQDSGTVYSSGSVWPADLSDMWPPRPGVGHAVAMPAGQQPHWLGYKALPEWGAASGNPYVEISVPLGTHLHPATKIWRGNLLTYFHCYSESLGPKLGLRDL